MRSVVILSLLLGLGAAPAAAQYSSAEETSYSFNAGLKLRGNLHINQSQAESSADAENGFGAGIEIVGNHLGVALYGFTHGKTADFDSETSPVNVVLEANYFLPIERIRLAPYVGVHTGLGVFTKDYFEDPFFPKPQDSFKDLGYQVGLRFKPIPLLGLDAQWRRTSVSVSHSQDASLERNQVLLGITLF